MNQARVWNCVGSVLFRMVLKMFIVGPESSRNEGSPSHSKGGSVCHCGFFPGCFQGSQGGVCVPQLLLIHPS